MTVPFSTRTVALSVRQVDLGVERPRLRLERALPPADAAGAGHAADPQLDGMFERLVADPTNGGGHGGRAAAFGMGAPRRQIDARPAHARH